MLTNVLLVIGLLFSSVLAGVKPGAKAKDFTVSALTGEEISLVQLRGQVVLINFWATWCAPCREELPRLAYLQAKYRQSGLTVLAISVDNERENITGFLQEHGLKLQAFWDRDKRVSRLYDPQTMPSSYLIDRKGTLRFLHNGYSPEELKRIEAEINQLLKPAAPPEASAKNKS